VGPVRLSCGRRAHASSHPDSIPQQGPCPPGAWLMTGCLRLRVSEYFRLAFMTPVPTREQLIYFLFLQLFLQVRTWNLQCFFFFVIFSKKKQKTSKVAHKSVKRREKYWLSINFQTENKMITHAETYSNVRSILRSINGKVDLTTL